MSNFTYKYQLREHPKNKRLGNMLDDLCDVHNHMLALEKRYYRIYGKYAGRWRLQPHLTKLLNRTKQHWRWIPRDTLDAIVIRLHLAWKRFFDYKAGKIKIKTGPPKFKSKKRNSLRSAKFPTGYRIDINDNFYTTLGGIDKGSETGTVNIYFKRWCPIRKNLVTDRRNFLFHYHRPFKGKIKYIQILRDRVGTYWLTIVTDHNAVSQLYSEFKPKPATEKSVGADYSMKDAYLTLSTSEKIQHLQPFKSALNRVRKLNKAISRKVEGSKNWWRMIRELARLHSHIASQRRDFQWKLANGLCERFDIICIETLNIAAMKRLWGRKTSDQAFSQFVKYLEHKCFKHARTLKRVGMWTATTKPCSECGYKNENLTLKDRSWACPECGAKHDRDINAAKNILRAAYDPAVEQT